MMTRTATAAVLTALFGATAARPPPSSHVRVEARTLHSGWAKGEPMDGRHIVPVHVGLAQSNLGKGAELLTQISHPASPSFASHLSADEVADLFAPSPERISAVRTWLESSLPNRTIALSPSRQWLRLNATVAELQALLHADYHSYENPITGQTGLGCDDYHVPSNVRGHVDFISPGVKTLQFRRRSALIRQDASAKKSSTKPKIARKSSSGSTFASSSSDCSKLVTPACIRAMYNVTDSNKGNPANSMGIYQSLTDSWNQADMDLFFKAYAPEIPQGTQPEYDSIDGAPINASARAGSESDLDFQASYPLVYPDNMVDYEVNDAWYEGDGELSYTGLFNSFLDALDRTYCNHSAFGETGDDPGVDPTYPDKHTGGWNHPEQCGAFVPASVISISYSTDEDRLPLNYQLRQCNEWMKLGLQGVSVVVASGDTGVQPRLTGCSRNDTLFATQSPIDCPYVTAVGATALPPGGVPGKTAERATTQFPTSGGFSNVFGQPSYQAAVVGSYFKSFPPPYAYYNITRNASHTHGVYNRGGRGYPDVSAVGQQFAVYYEGEPAAFFGTSASAPLFGAMIARINSARMNAGKKALGFLNPILYSHPEVFNDITKGTNPGCQTKGFAAVEGWDPVSGLGTPNYGKMKDAFMSLP